MSKGTPVRTFRMGDEQYKKLLRVVARDGYEDIRGWLEAVADGKISKGVYTYEDKVYTPPSKKAPLPREEERDAGFDWGA